LLVTHRGRTTSVEIAKAPIVIGRSHSCEVFLDDQQVSRRHAEIRPDGDRLTIVDLGSHNGTLLLANLPDSDETQSRASAEVRLAPNVVTPLPADALIQVGTALLTIHTASRVPRPVGRGGFIVVDAAMQRVLELADRVAPTNLTVLLLGESGAGKDMLARYVHDQSPRVGKRLVSLNCGALPETLLESELFGYEKGAFTGAMAAKIGLLEAADGGTLFLDEIGELSPALQVKLLRVLEDRQVLRVGAVEPKTVDVRFVAATNRDLEQQVKDGKFREDLYYRIYGIALHVPPLRERRADIVPLAERFVAELAGGSPKRLSPAAIAKLAGYDWPGNVRQLKNVVHRAVVMAVAADIGPDDIDLPRPSSPAIAIPAALPSGDPEQLRALAEDAERRRILEAIEACGGNQTRAAEKLGITRRVLVRKLEKFDLPRPRQKRE
jgi:DNA-binding NtrC family response regulator